MKKELPSKQAIEKELAELESVLVTGKDGLPVVFCHGDLCPANITFDPGSAQQFCLSSQFVFQCCYLLQLLNTQKNVPFNLNLHFDLQF